MKVFFKNITINKFTTKITFEHGDSVFDRSIRDEAKAVSVLLGAYHEYGRRLGLEKYNEVRRRFEELLEEVKENMY